MTRSELRDRLDEMFAPYFLTREELPEGTLYLAPDPIRLGDLQRLLVARDVANGFPAQLPDAVERAVKMLREDGGDVVIRCDREGAMVVRREALGAA